MSFLNLIFDSYVQMIIEQVNAVDKLREIEGISIQTVWREVRLGVQPQSMYVKYTDDKSNIIYAGEVSRNQCATTIKNGKEADWLEARLRYIAEQLSKN